MNPQSVTLETDRLILRRHTTEDFGGMLRLWTAPEVAHFIAGGRAQTEEEVWQRLLRYGGLWPLLGFGYFALIDKASGAYAGEAGLADFHREIEPSLAGQAEAGWALMPECWGKGLANEALSAILDWYLAQPAARPVSCFIDLDNKPSNRLAARVGFRLNCITEYKGAACNMYIR